MASKIKVKTKFDFSGELGKLTSKATLTKMGNAIVRESLKSIFKGVSPVKGEGKFKSYAMDRDNDKTKYPYPHTKRGKRKKPVNLRLSGDMLSYLTHWIKRKGFTDKTLWVGIKDDAPDDVKKRAEAHNDGTLEKQNVPKRQFVPNKKGDQYSNRIQLLINKIFSDRIEEVIKKSNK